MKAIIVIASSFLVLPFLGCKADQGTTSDLSHYEATEDPEAPQAESSVAAQGEEEESVQIAANYVRIKHKASGKCLDVKNNAKHNGAEVVPWNCHGGANQDWEKIQVGNYVVLKSRSAGKCLDLVGPNQGGKVVLWDCHHRNNQKFLPVHVNGGIQLAAPIGYDACIDFTRHNTVVHWKCHYRNEQTFIPI